jgi:hypothetical protein
MREARMHRLVFAALCVVAGCGGSDPAQNFVGTWTFASGTDNVACPNGTTSTKLTGSLTVKRGTDGGLVVLDGRARARGSAASPCRSSARA